MGSVGKNVRISFSTGKDATYMCLSWGLVHFLLPVPLNSISRSLRQGVVWPLARALQESHWKYNLIFDLIGLLECVGMPLNLEDKLTKFQFLKDWNSLALTYKLNVFGVTDRFARKRSLLSLASWSSVSDPKCSSKTQGSHLISDVANARSTYVCFLSISTIIFKVNSFLIDDIWTPRRLKNRGGRENRQIDTTKNNLRFFFGENF